MGGVGFAMRSLRLAFMGTPDFAVPALRALARAGHRLVAVYCQSPKPAGRGQQLRKSPVQIEAEAMGVEVRTPKTLRDPEEQARFRALDLDGAVVAAYGLILPQAVLDAPRHGCLNIHGSLLPRWRGAAPIHRAILAGDDETGITIMRMDAGLDTGAMLMKQSLPITDQTTAQTLHDAMAELGAKMIIEALEGMAAGTLQAVPQPEAGVTYAAKLTREDGAIDWRKPAAEIARQVRALTPWPGTYFIFRGEAVKVLIAEAVEGSGGAGALLDEQFTVACGQGGLRLLSVQRAGKAAMEGAAFLRGARVCVGEVLA